MTRSTFDQDLTIEIKLTADLLNEIEHQRKRVGNRRGAMTRTEPDSDGEVRGLGYREDSYPVVLLDTYLAELAVQEGTMIKALEGAIKRHPLAPWVKAQRGVGLKQIGRLLACIGDPSWHPVEERPRTLPELYAYCGQVPGMLRVRGVPAAEADQWNAEAKMRLYLVAESVMKQRDRGCRVVGEDGSTTTQHADTCRCGPYRLIYEQRRAWTADRLHSEPCVRCGPSGHPAQPGSPWPDKHKHGDALRYVGKRILRDLWRQARTVNGFTGETSAAA